MLSSRVPPYGEMIRRQALGLPGSAFGPIRWFPAFQSEPKERALGAVAGARENWFAGEAFGSVLKPTGRRRMMERGDLPGVDACGQVRVMGGGCVGWSEFDVAGDVGVGGDAGGVGGRGFAAGEQTSEETGESEGG